MFLLTQHSTLLLLITSLCIATSGYAQTVTSIDQLGRDQARVITTAVPFLTISPDARSGAMGDVGAAISPDANAMHWNAAKLAFSEQSMGFALSYTPWLRKLINDMSISYLTGYKKLSKQEAIAASLTYFNLGNIEFTDNNGAKIQDFRPREYSAGITYSRKLSDRFSIAPTIKYIYSNLSGNLFVGNNTQTRPGHSAAVDLGTYYVKDITLQGRPSKLALAAVISNFGGKISYTTNDQRDFIPTNLRLGSALTYEIDPFNKVTFAVDANKLMVPSPPLYSPTNRDSIVRGKNPNRSLFSGVFGSFADAPYGLSEELKEVMIGSAVEYWYNNLFAIRGGYFYENKLKGNRKYFTLGLGIRYNMFGLDFAYLIAGRKNNPLAETLRFTLHFDFEAKKKEESITE
ncbi:MAG: type IX secretion system outer membrane channel protein PorV [Cytophagaceae bacterium]|nr:type IX secretion system outer membrane channel protein PorV [Cytophagaceae bacterium]MDW8456145.1 type IX secretion system outer membrane channel protein PorV [Cytophagaceae bacterium]